MKKVIWEYKTRRLTMSAETNNRMRVVLADDDDDWRSLLAGVLESAGYEVNQAADGQELRTLLEADEAAGSTPDLIVSDHGMPHVTGLQVLEWASDHHLNVPFILLSAFAGPFIRGPALALGAAAVMDKPVDVHQLQLRIAQVLHAKPKG